MFLQMQNRRQFLERSAWGFGSAFVLPTLLQSCMTDHVIPPINPPIIPPLTDGDIDWNDDARIAVIGALEMIPEVGEILGPLADIFWPKDKPSPWDQVKAQVEALVDQKIADTVYQLVSEDLGSLTPVPSGLIGALTLYQNEVNNGTPSEILSQWLTTKSLFVNALGHFQSKGYELPLLGLFGQFANMFLGLLRDGVISGQSWGRTEADHQQDMIDLQTYISGFTTYTTNTYQNARANLVKNTKRNDHECEPFRTVNAFDRQMALLVLDFRDSWQYYDVTKYPNGVNVVLTREIYTDPFGTCDDSGPIVIASPAPTQRPTNLTVWAYDRIDAVQLTYPAGSGPGGVTTTPRMGDQGGGTNQPPRGGSFNLTLDNPIIQARALYYVYQAYTGGAVGPVVTGMQFLFNDGTPTNVLGNQNLNSVLTYYDTGLLGYLYEFVSSVHINGVNKAIGSADCVVFGFQYWNPPAATLRAIGRIYITSPKERSVADFARAFPKLGLSANSISEELKAARKAYWEYIKKRVK